MVYVGIGIYMLYVIGMDYVVVIYVVFVCKFIFEYIGNDFYVMVVMGIKVLVCGYVVFVDYLQWIEVYVFGIIVVCEGKVVI